MSAVVIRTNNQALLNRLAKEYDGRIVKDDVSLGYQVPGKGGSRMHISLFAESYEANVLANEPTLEQSRTLLNSLTPTMKNILKTLISYPKPVSINKFDREIVTRDIENVIRTFNGRASKFGFVNEKGAPVEVISANESNVRGGGTGVRYRVAQTARLAIRVFDKSLD